MAEIKKGHPRAWRFSTGNAFFTKTRTDAMTGFNFVEANRRKPKAINEPSK
jgi:hypothetical protein